MGEAAAADHLQAAARPGGRAAAAQPAARDATGGPGLAHRHPGRRSRLGCGRVGVGGGGCRSRRRWEL
eukprot:6132181-Prymnesium_polylepis.1